MIKTISAKDIVGRKIKSVFQTPWSVFEESEGCEVFILLDNDLLFELTFVDDVFVEFPIEKKEKEYTANLIEAEFLLNTPNCLGDIIKNIVVSEYWPTFGLELSSKRFLYARDWGTPFKFGAFVEPITKETATDVFVYGGKVKVLAR